MKQPTMVDMPSNQTKPTRLPVNCGWGPVILEDGILVPE